MREEDSKTTVFNVPEGRLSMKIGTLPNGILARLELKGQGNLAPPQTVIDEIYKTLTKWVEAHPDES